MKIDKTGLKELIILHGSYKIDHIICLVRIWNHLVCQLQGICQVSELGSERPVSQGLEIFHERLGEIYGKPRLILVIS